MLRTCLAAAEVDGSVCVFLEPIALYHTRDLHADGDNGWLAPYAAAGGVGARPRPDRPGPGVRRRRAPDDRSPSATGYGCRCGWRRAWPTEGIGARVVDLRWLAPLPVADIVREAAATGRVLVVDETRRSGGVGEGVLAALVDAGYVGAARRVASADSYIPLGNAARHLLVSEEMIEAGCPLPSGRLTPYLH